MDLTVTSLDENLNVIVITAKDMSELLILMESQLRGKKWHLEDFLGDVRISTVFIPTFNRLDNYNFETMVFTDGNCSIINRYQTVEEAKKGHNECVAALVI